MFVLLECVELVRRLKALTLALLPVEVSPDRLEDPTSRVITHQVVSSYIAAAGDLIEAVWSSNSLQWPLNHTHIIRLAAILSPSREKGVYVGSRPQSSRLWRKPW